MLYYHYLFLIIMVLLVFLLIRSTFKPKTTNMDKLFAEALQRENSGQYQEAILTYKSALAEIRKSRFRSENELENRILEKLKVLNSTIEYEKGFNDNKKQVL